MMSNKIKDERIEGLKLKVKSEVVYIIGFILLVSIAEKAWVFNQPISSFMTEIVSLLAMVVYIFLRNLWLGNLFFLSEEVNKKVVILSTLVSSIALTVVFAINNYQLYASKYSGIFDPLFWGAILIMLVQLFILCLIFFMMVGKAEQKKYKQLESED